MRPLPSPAPPRLDLSTLRAQLALAAGVAVVAGVILWAWTGRDLHTTLGDTDDATRLVMVRDLIAGRGWYDQLLTRLQPPRGVWMHWSRLLDGGIAAFDLLLRPVLGPSRAETATRLLWPLLWMFPASAAAIVASARVADRSGRGEPLATYVALAAAALVVAGVGQLAIQFHPGRIDHHDVQITFALIALAGAATPGRRGAVVSGAACGVGLAIGLEALIFEAAIAGTFGLRLLFSREQARPVAAFGLALAAATALAFVAQTPPARWAVPACDALGSNLLCGAVTGGMLLAAAALTVGGRGWAVRLAALAVAGGVALAVYLGLDPHCLRGPFADVDPAIRPFWLDHVNEVKPLRQLWKSDKTDAVVIVVDGLMAGSAWAALGLVPARRRDPAWWSMGLLLALAFAATASAIRMRGYLEWFAVVPLAAAAAEAAARLPRLRPLAALGLGALFAPAVLGGVVLLCVGVTKVPLPPAVQGLLALVAVAGVVVLALRVVRTGPRASLGLGAIVLPLVVVVGLLLNAQRLHAKAKPGRPEPADVCFDAASYAPLAARPAGLALSEVDLGPFVLAHTPSSAMSAPYHRMSWGLLKDRAVFTAPADGDAPDGAQARARALGAAYVLECPVHRGHADRDNLSPASLQARLDRGMYPDWLAPLTPATAGLQVYRLLPPPAAASPHTGS